MTIERKSTQTASSKKSEAFLNLHITDKNGNKHSIKAFIPMDSSDGDVARSIITKAKNDPDTVFEIEGTVGFAKLDEGKSDLFG